MHNGIGGQRGLTAALGALIPSGTAQRMTMSVTAHRADKTLGPLDLVQILGTGLFVRKTLKELCIAHGLLNGFACCFLFVHNGTTFMVPLSHTSCPLFRTYSIFRPRLF